MDAAVGFAGGGISEVRWALAGAGKEDTLSAGLADPARSSCGPASSFSEKVGTFASASLAFTVSVVFVSECSSTIMSTSALLGDMPEVSC